MCPVATVSVPINISGAISINTGKTAAKTEQESKTWGRPLGACWAKEQFSGTASGTRNPGEKITPTGYLEKDAKKSVVTQLTKLF